MKKQTMVPGSMCFKLDVMTPKTWIPRLTAASSHIDEEILVNWTEKRNRVKSNGQPTLIICPISISIISTDSNGSDERAITAKKNTRGFNLIEKFSCPQFVPEINRMDHRMFDWIHTSSALSL
jgi:hypothetical protein